MWYSLRVMTDADASYLLWGGEVFLLAFSPISLFSLINEGWAVVAHRQWTGNRSSHHGGRCARKLQLPSTVGAGGGPCSCCPFPPGVILGFSFISSKKRGAEEGSKDGRRGKAREGRNGNTWGRRLQRVRGREKCEAQEKPPDDAFYFADCDLRAWLCQLSLFVWWEVFFMLCKRQPEWRYPEKIQASVLSHVGKLRHSTSAAFYLAPYLELLSAFCPKRCGNFFPTSSPRWRICSWLCFSWSLPRESLPTAKDPTRFLSLGLMGWLCPLVDWKVLNEVG